MWPIRADSILDLAPGQRCFSKIRHASTERPNGELKKHGYAYLWMGQESKAFSKPVFFMVLHGVSLSLSI
jgi:hypothetical protein